MAHGIKLHVWGDYALFTRPEMKVERVSYDVMTPSAARGILEAIGTPDAFISEAGSQKWMREQCGLTAPAVAERIAGRYRAVR